MHTKVLVLFPVLLSIQLLLTFASNVLPCFHVMQLTKKEISNSNTSSRLSKQIHKIKIDGPKSPFVDYINNKMIPKFPQHYYDSANYPYLEDDLAKLSL